MIPLIARGGLTAWNFIRNRSLLTLGLGAGAITLSGANGKEGPLQNFLTNAFSTVTTAISEADVEARWQGFYKFLHKGVEFLQNIGLGRFLDPLLRMIGTSLDDLKNVAERGLTEDNTTDLTRLDVDSDVIERAVPTRTLGQSITDTFNTAWSYVPSTEDVKSTINEYLPSFQRDINGNELSFTDSLVQSWRRVATPVENWLNNSTINQKNSISELGPMP